MPTTYEHIDKYSDVLKHEEENLVLLCTSCQSQSTSGILAKDQIREAQKKPYSLSGRPPRYSFLHRRMEFLEALGSLLLLIDNQSVVILGLDKIAIIKCDIQNGIPLFSIKIPNSNGEVVFEVEQNVVTFNPKKLWDLEFKGAIMTLRRKHKKITLELSLSDAVLRIVKMRLFHHGIAVKFYRDKFSFWGVKSLGPGEIYANLIEPSSVSNQAIFANNSFGGKAVFRLNFDKGNLDEKTAFKWLG